MNPKEKGALGKSAPASNTHETMGLAVCNPTTDPRQLSSNPISRLLEQADAFEQRATETGNSTLAAKHRAIRRELERLAFGEGAE